MRGRAARIAPVLVVVTGIGCGSPAERTQRDLEPIPDTPPTLDVEFGSGIERFEPLSEDAPVELTYGPQGGFHIWTSSSGPRSSRRTVDTARPSAS